MPAGTDPAARSRANESARAAEKTPTASGGAEGTPRVDASSGVLRPLDGVVLVSGTPLDGGSVSIVSSGRRPLAGTDQPTEGRIPVGPDGTFHLPRVQRGLVLSVEADGVSPRTFRVTLNEEGAQRVVLAFGTGRIWGSVRDELGRPAEGVYIELSSYMLKGPDG